MITAGDFLAGGGGVTHAMTKIDNLKVLWVLNHSQVAIRTNMFNHKGIKHYWSDLYKQDEHEMEPVDFVWASIECTQHSKANGGKKKKIGSYTLGWELLRYLKHINPFVIGIENVPEFKDWAPVDGNGDPIKEKKGEEFKRWKNTICNMGYDYHELICNAADYGIPTRRVRYFAFFTRKELDIIIDWPEKTHSKNGENGLKKWVPCKNYINLTEEGQSIFGREFNSNIKKGKRHPLSENTLKRIAGGIKKFSPDLYFILHYYSNGNTSQSIQSPLNTIPTKTRHALITLEKLQFIQDHCYTDNFNLIDEPLNPVLTRQQKQLITIENKFLSKYQNNKDKSGKLQDHASDINLPFPTIKTINNIPIISCKANFISKQYNSNGKPESNNKDINEPLPTVTSQNKDQFISIHYGNGNNKSIEEPLNSITTHEKVQFITTYFNSSGKPGSQNQSLDSPLNSILTGTNKKALITSVENGDFDFDIKMRFLEPEELSLISTFPEKYFTNPLLKLTKKDQVKLIGNAVPPDWAEIIIKPVIKNLDEILLKQKIAI